MASLSRGREQGQFGCSGKAREGAERIFDCRSFVSAVDHTVGTLVIAARAVSVPFREFYQFTKGFGVALLKQIAGFLPTKDIVRRIAPGRALIVTTPH